MMAEEVVAEMIVVVGPYATLDGKAKAEAEPAMGSGAERDPSFAEDSGIFVLTGLELVS